MHPAVMLSGSATAGAIGQDLVSIWVGCVLQRLLCRRQIPALLRYSRAVAMSGDASSVFVSSRHQHCRHLPPSQLEPRHRPPSAHRGVNGVTTHSSTVCFMPSVERLQHRGRPPSVQNWEPVGEDAWEIWKLRVLPRSRSTAEEAIIRRCTCTEILTLRCLGFR